MRKSLMRGLFARGFACAVAVTLAAGAAGVGVSVAGVAAAAPNGVAVAVAAPAEGEMLTLERTFTYMAGQDAPAIPDTISEQGAVWQLVQVTDPAPDPTFAPATERFTYADSGNFATLEEAYAAFPDTWPISRDGFAGDIPQTSFTVRELEATATHVAERTQTFGPFDTNDVANIPEDLWDSYISWEVLAVNDVGRPVAYEATVRTQYYIYETYVESYDVSVTYAGTLAKDEMRYTITATYEVPASALAQAQPRGMASTAVAGIAGGGAAVAVAAIAVLLRRSRNVSVCAADDGRILAKVHAARRGNALAVTLPARIPAQRGLVFELRRDLCDGGPFEVRQAGKVVFAGFAAQRVEM